MDLNKFVDQYIETALWSSNDDEGMPLDKVFDADGIDPATKKRMVKDCSAFLQKAKDLLELSDMDESEAAHKFWLSRNGHGTGLWDVDDWKNPRVKQRGKTLHEIAKKFGEFDLYVGDDGYIHGGSDYVPDHYGVASASKRLAAQHVLLLASAVQRLKLAGMATAADLTLKDREEATKALQVIEKGIDKASHMSPAQTVNQALVMIGKALTKYGDDYRDALYYFLGGDVSMFTETLDMVVKMAARQRDNEPGMKNTLKKASQTIKELIEKLGGKSAGPASVKPAKPSGPQEFDFGD